MVNFYKRFLIRFVSSYSGCGCGRSILPRSWKALFLQCRYRLYLNSIKAHIYKLPCSPWCRLCGVVDETVDHLISNENIKEGMMPLPP